MRIDEETKESVLDEDDPLREAMHGNRFLPGLPGCHQAVKYAHACMQDQLSTAHYCSFAEVATAREISSGRL